MSLSKDTNNLAVSAVCKIFHRTPRFKAPANTVHHVLVLLYFHIFFQIENVRFHGYDKLCHCQLKGGEDTATTKKSCDDAIRIREEPRILCDRAEVFHEKNREKIVIISRDIFLF